MYYLAVVAPEHIADKVAALKQYMLLQYDCRAALKSPAHITLVPPFRMQEALVESLVQCINDISASQQPFSVQLQDFDFFIPRVIFIKVLPNPVLENLHLQLNEALQALQFPISIDTRPYHPHVTIATRDLTKKAFNKASQYFQGKKYRADWPVRGISLLRLEQKKWEVIYTSHFPQ